MTAADNIQFGVSIDPSAANWQESQARARLADKAGFDMLTVMDHPYNNRLFDTWTLLTALGGITERIHLVPNVLSLPLRPPAVLAKSAATLDVVTGGRFEMALGAGSYWDGISAFGGERRSPGEAYGAFKDALHISRGFWDNAGGSFSYEGEIYQVKGIRPGPAPAHRIPIWGGARGPRMLRLLGRMADGLFTSYSYNQPQRLTEINQLMDEGAEQAERETNEIRRGYNLMGILDVGTESTSRANANEDMLSGDAKAWSSRIIEWAQKYRMDTFVFWPAGEDAHLQVETFAQEVIPAVRGALTETPTLKEAV